MKWRDCISETADIPLMECGGIYMLEIGGRFYVGSATNFQRRLKEHIGSLRRNQHCNPRVQRSFNKHKHLKFTIVEIVEDEQQILSVEQHYLDMLFSDKQCLNIMDLAAGGGISQRRAVIVDGVKFKSITAVADHFRTDVSTVGGWLTGRYPAPLKYKFDVMRYADEAISRVVRNPIHRPVVVDGVVFESVVKAAEHLGFNPAVLGMILKKRCPVPLSITATELRYEDEPKVELWRNPITHAVIVDEVEYQSITDAATSVGVTAKILSEWVSGRSTIPIRYGVRSVRYPGQPDRSRINPQKKSIIFNGQQFPTVNDAASAIGCQPKQLSKWLCGYAPIPKHRNIFELRYA